MRFEKGYKPWNKGTKGIMKKNKTSFKKKDERIYGKKQTIKHIKNALRAKGHKKDIFMMSKEKQSAYRYFYNLKRNHDMTKKDYENMLVIQNNVCAICGKPNKQKRRLCVDHDHKTGKVRGLLCVDCNVCLGNANDDIEILKNMIDYLKV
jgi:hypothetical protein